MPTFAVVTKQTVTMDHKNIPTEVLSFKRGDNLATIATNGTRHVSQEFELVKEHSTLSRAIGYLEAKGYNLLIDQFESV